MTTKKNLHALLALTINLGSLAFLLRTYQKAMDVSDKAIILPIFFYFVLIMANLIVWLVLRLKRKNEFKIYRAITIGLILLFLPCFMVVTEFSY